MKKFYFYFSLLVTITAAAQSTSSTQSENMWNFVFSELPTKASSNLTCDTCVDIVDIIDYGTKVANDSIVELEKLITFLCETIDPIVSGECETLLKYIDQIVQWILKGVYTAPQICQKLGFCPSFIA